jgi:hypothetical protein
MQKDEIISNLHQESGPICTSLNWHELDPSGDRTKLFVSLHATRLVIENKSLAAFVDEQTVPALGAAGCR